MNVIVTGGAGYLGFSLIERLIGNDAIDKIIIYDNLARQNYNIFTNLSKSKTEIQFIKGDILDSYKLNKIMKDVDICYHLAAKVTTPFSDNQSHSYEQVNHWGTSQVVEAVELSGRVRSFIYISSISVYGSIEGIVDESHQPAPRSFYGTSKLNGESQLTRIQDICKVYILRLANLYGYNPLIRYDSVINKFIYEANYFRRLLIHGNGTQKRAFIHVSKAAEIMSSIIYEDVPTGIYNLHEHNLSIVDIVDHLSSLYKDLEYVKINHNMKMRTIEVETPPKLSSYIHFTKQSLEAELLEFKQVFKFGNVLKNSWWI